MGVAKVKITEIELLSLAQSQSISRSVELLRHHWRQRFTNAPFFTLGASNTFDLVTQSLQSKEIPYFRMLQNYNPILRNSFGWLYDTLLLKLADYLKAPVVFSPHLALPGFHIFLGSPAFADSKDLLHQEWFYEQQRHQTVSSPIHCDTPHLAMPFRCNKEDIDLKEPISFTLPIDLPQSGGGLNYWDLSLSETISLGEKAIHDRLNQVTKHYLGYKIGHLVLHSGQFYHQIAAMPSMKQDESRITMQGHGVRIQDTWHLYW